MTYTFEDLKEIITTLRSENGCPWDRAQTHASLKPHFLEETNEALEALTEYEMTKNGDHFCEELGDVLLQIMLHSQIAEETGSFTINDVIDTLAKKMVRRHPNVFGLTEENSKNGRALSWQEIKKLEK